MKEIEHVFSFPNVSRVSLILEELRSGIKPINSLLDNSLSEVFGLE